MEIRSDWIGVELATGRTTPFEEVVVVVVVVVVAGRRFLCVGKSAIEGRRGETDRGHR